MGSYHRPDNLKDALDVLAVAPVTVAAGCTDLFAATEAQALAGDVLDVTGIAAMQGVSQVDGAWRIGATTTWAEIAAVALPEGMAMLQQAARQVGSVQVQTAGTIGGNLCNASPAADGVPPLLTLDAEVELASTEGVRRMDLAAFLRRPRETALRAGELLTAVIVPEASTAGQSVFLKLGSRAHLVISVAMAAARIEAKDGRVVQAAVSVGACGPVAVRLPALEAALVGASVDDAAAFAAVHVPAVLAPIDDLRGTAGYRRAAAVELTARAVLDCLEVV